MSDIRPTSIRLKQETKDRLETVRREWERKFKRKVPLAVVIEAFLSAPTPDLEVYLSIVKERHLVRRNRTIRIREDYLKAHKVAKSKARERRAKADRNQPADVKKTNPIESEVKTIEALCQARGDTLKAIFETGTISLMMGYSPEVDLDGPFLGTCLETGERLNVNGHLFEMIPIE
jgi:hypothetical protein